MRTTIKVNELYQRANTNLDIASRAFHDGEIKTFIFRLNAAQEDMQLLRYPIKVCYDEIAKHININLYNELYDLYLKIISDIC